MKGTPGLILFYFLLFVTAFWGCDSSSEPSRSVLSINTESLALTQMNNVGFFVITNAGEDVLSWTITSIPGWLTVSKGSGSVTTGADTVEVVADIFQPAGTYEEKIVIESNGDSKAISVTFAVQLSIEVFPGVGAANVSLGDPYSAIIREHGFSDTFLTAFDSAGVTIGHIVQYLDKGLGFYLVGNGLTPEQTDLTSRIILEMPYKGVTEGYIGIGSSLTELQNIFGQPDTIDATSRFWEYSSGIKFYHNSTSVVKIEVF